MNGEHLSPKTRELLNRPVEERVAYIQKDSWIPYSHANRILQQLEDLLNHPKCDRMPNLVISAQTREDTSHQAFLIAAPSQRAERRDHRGAGVLFAMPRLSR
jgi:Bacterial TniB protein